MCVGRLGWVGVLRIVCKCGREKAWVGAVGQVCCEGVE